MNNFSGKNYILISLANSYGFSNLTWEERISKGKSLFTDFSKNPAKILNAAEEPFLFQKAINAYKDTINSNPTGYIMGLDATASGLQILSCLIGCKKTASAVNLIDPSTRKNVYSIIAKGLGTTTSKAKKPIMTFFYGSKKQPEEAFGKKVGDFYSKVTELLPGACEVKDDINSCWDSNALVHQWTLPDGHTARVKVMCEEAKEITLEELNNTTFSYKLIVNKPKKREVSLIGNITHSIDGYIDREMHRMSEKQGFEMLSIYDCFFASPNYMNNIRKNYIIILSRIANSNILRNILREITGNSQLQYDKYSTTLGGEILKSSYALS